MDPKNQQDLDGEKIHHPAHYGGADNPYECIKVIESWGLGFNLGSALKYISRAGKKPEESGIQDIHKALWYVDREIRVLKGAGEIDVAWAAGFFDGEGYIGISRGYSRNKRWGPYHHMSISASQRIREPLDRLVSIFDGTVCKATTRDLYLWTCTTRCAARALTAMLPYLSVKAPQARVALSFQARRKSGGTAKADGVQDNKDRVELARLKRVDGDG